LLLTDQLGQTIEAADPGNGFRGLEVSRWSVFVRPAYLEVGLRWHRADAAPPGFP
jgi:hypothetical protein